MVDLTKASDAIAKFYDALDKFETEINEAAAIEDKALKLEVLDCCVVAICKVTDENGEMVSKACVVQSSTSDYGTHGLLLKGTEVVA